VIRLLIADDHELMRGGLRAMLGAQDDMEVVGEASDGGEAVEQALALRPDVVIMDIRMPRVDGIEATRRLAVHGPSPRVLVLTTFDLDEYVWEALRAGAAGFMLKDAPPRQLAEAVRAVAVGETCSRRRSPAGSSSATSASRRREALPARSDWAN
jgi:DNA-binding NarL/FixJ family response regulator